MKLLMMLDIKKVGVALLVGVSLLGLSQSANAICKGKMINPVKDTNWNNLFPMTLVSGVKLGSGKNNSFLHKMPAVCKCPHQVLPGAGITFHTPDYLGEVVSEPMCVVSLPGAKLTSAYDRNRGSNGGNQSGSDGNAAYKHVHVFAFDLFKMMSFFKKFIGCLDTTEYASTVPGANMTFGVKYLSEIDPMHPNTMWAIAFTPEALLFANPAGLFSCIPDMIASTFGRPVDALFWCGGVNGVMYPFDGYAKNSSGVVIENMDIMQRHLAKGHRSFLYSSTIGPWAQCMTMPLGLVTKSQYRFDPTFPNPVRNGPPILWGENPLKWATGRVINTPNPNNGQDSAYIIWQGRQCCVTK